MSESLGCQSWVFTTSGCLDDISGLSIHQLVHRGCLSLSADKMKYNHELDASPLPHSSHRTPLPLCRIPRN